MKSEPRKNNKPPRKKSEPRKLGLESLESRALMAGLHGDHGGPSFGWGGARVDRGFDAVSYGYEFGAGYGSSGPGGRGHGGYADYHANYVTYDEAPTVLQVRYLLVVMPGGDSPRGNRGFGEGEATSSRPGGGANLESSYRDLGSVGSGLSNSSLSNSGLSGSSLNSNSPGNSSLGNSSLGNSPLNNSLASSYGGRDSGASLGLRSPLESSQPSSSGRDNSSPSLNSSSLNSTSLNSSSSDSREAPRGGTSGSVSGGPTNVVVGSLSSTSTSTSGTSRVFGGPATDLGLAAQASSGSTSGASDSFDSLSHGASPLTERRSSVAGVTAMSLSNRGKSPTGLGSALDRELTDGDSSGESRGGRGSSGDDWNDLFVDIAGLMDGRASQADSRQRVATRGDRRSLARRDDLRWDAMSSDRSSADRAAQVRNSHNNQAPAQTSRDAAQREFERQASLSRRADRDGRMQNGEQADEAQDAAGRATSHDATFVYANDRRNAGRSGRQFAEQIGSRTAGGDVQSVVRLLDAQGGAGPTAWAQSVDDSLVELTHERRWLNGQEQGAKAAGSTSSRPVGALAGRSLAVQVAAAQFGTSSRSDAGSSDVGQDGTQRIELLRSSDSGARHQVFEIDAGSGDVAGPVLPGAE